MKMPNIETLVKDPSKGVTYIIVAYRTVTKNEALQAIAALRSQKRFKLQKGMQYIIQTIIGFDE